jgi:hypothetical protein
VILNQLERAFMVIGDRVMAAGNKSLDDYDIKDENITNELVVTHRKPSHQHPIETRQSLNNITKQQICDKCVEIFGVDLNFRTEKKHLITEYIELQETITQEN